MRVRLQCTIHRLGELASLCEVLPPATLNCQQRTWATALRTSNWVGVADVVPGMNNLTPVFGPLADTQRLTAQLCEAWEESQALVTDDRLVDIKVVYGSDEGPDLHEVAKHTGLSTTEVAHRHTVPKYTVYFLDFQPGFVYVGGPDESLATPCRAESHMAVSAGLTGIGGEQTGIYPVAPPNDW